MVLILSLRCRLLLVIFCFFCVGDGAGMRYHPRKKREFTEEQKKYWQSLKPEQKKEHWEKKRGGKHPGMNNPQIKAKFEGRETFKKKIQDLTKEIISEETSATHKKLQDFLEKIKTMESEHVELSKPVHGGQRGLAFSNEFKEATKTSMETISLLKTKIKKELEAPLEQALLLLKAKLLTLAKSLK